MSLKKINETNNQMFLIKQNKIKLTIYLILFIFS